MPLWITGGRDVSPSASPGLVEGSVQRGQEGLQVRARGDLRDDAAVAGILVHRRSRAIYQQLRAAHQANARFVAG